jgi:hypothetical protein
METMPATMKTTGMARFVEAAQTAMLEQNIANIATINVATDLAAARAEATADGDIPPSSTPEHDERNDRAFARARKPRANA